MTTRWTKNSTPRKSVPRNKALVPKADSAVSISNDGWSNVVTGMGYQSRDRKMLTKFTAGQQYLQEAELLNIYAEDGVGKRVIDVVVDDMVREWFVVSGDTENTINKYMRKFAGKKYLTESLRWGSLHGGSIAIIGINDGGTYEDPVRENVIRSIDHMHVFDRWRVQVLEADLYKDPKVRKYGKPEFYTVYPLEGTQFRVHESRVLRFNGPDTPLFTRRENQGWNFSDLQQVYDRLRGFGEATNGVEHIMSEFIIGVLKVANLQELIGSGKEAAVVKRLNLIDMTKHILNSVILDTKEEFTRVTSGVSGLSDLYRNLWQSLSASTGIPVTVLMGESPKGLDATGESDIRRYYDMIAARQEDRLLPNLEVLVRYVMLARDGPTNGRVQKDWSIVFPPLWQPTAQEMAETRLKVAQADAIYLENQVVSPEEVAISRFAGTEYSPETRLAEERSFTQPTGDE